MGYKIRECREAAGLTQIELSKKSGVSRTTIVALESDNPPTTTLKTLAKIASALGTTIEHIFFEESV